MVRCRGYFSTHWFLVLYPGSIGVPVVLLVLEGGPNTVQTMYELIKKKVPAVVIDGSGRAANVVAFAYSHTIKKWLVHGS